MLGLCPPGEGGHGGSQGAWGGRSQGFRPSWGGVGTGLPPLLLGWGDGGAVSLCRCQLGWGHTAALRVASFQGDPQRGAAEAALWRGPNAFLRGHAQGRCLGLPATAWPLPLSVPDLQEAPSPPQDMADSRRINANIREEDEKRPAEEQPPFGVYAVILSSEFWPPFKDEKLEVPEDIREALEVYCRKYEKLKVWPRLWGAGTSDESLCVCALRSAPSPPLLGACLCRCAHSLHALLCPQGAGSGRVPGPPLPPSTLLACRDRPRGSRGLCLSHGRLQGVSRLLLRCLTSAPLPSCPSCPSLAAASWSAGALGHPDRAVCC